MVLFISFNCRGDISLCELPRYYQSLWTAVVLPVSVNCHGTTSLCELLRFYQSLCLHVCPLWIGALTRGAQWRAGLPDSLHVGNQTLWTTTVLYVSVNYRGAISLYELPRCYLFLLTAVVLSVSVNCRGTTSLCEFVNCHGMTSPNQLPQYYRSLLVLTAMVLSVSVTCWLSRCYQSLWTRGVLRLNFARRRFTVYHYAYGPKDARWRRRSDRGSSIVILIITIS